MCVFSFYCFYSPLPRLAILTIVVSEVRVENVHSNTRDDITREKKKQIPPAFGEQEISFLSFSFLCCWIHTHIFLFAAVRYEWCETFIKWKIRKRNKKRLLKWAGGVVLTVQCNDYCCCAQQTKQKENQSTTNHCSVWNMCNVNALIFNVGIREIRLCHCHVSCNSRKKERREEEKKEF